MFKFGFSKENNAKADDNSQERSLNWVDASKIDVSSPICNQTYESDDYFERNNSVNIVEAESQYSDLIPAKYEGGLKIWECTYDLGEYILRENIDLENKLVLDLGCGAGIIGLIALSRGSVVHFQDYNAEVITSVTIPNVFLNFEDKQRILKKCVFYSGDWASFTTLLLKDNKDKNEKYDYIFTSETIYNPDNHRKLYDVFKKKLKPSGVGFVAAKTYYFGVGGGMRQFENVVKEDGTFNAQVVWKTSKGLQREILKLSWP